MKVGNGFSEAPVSSPCQENLRDTNSETQKTPFSDDESTEEPEISRSWLPTDNSVQWDEIPRSGGELQTDGGVQLVQKTTCKFPKEKDHVRYMPKAGDAWVKTEIVREVRLRAKGYRQIQGMV